MVNQTVHVNISFKLAQVRMGTPIKSYLEPFRINFMVIASLLAISGVSAIAQTNVGQISGRVKDTSGAAVANSQIFAANKETGEKRTVQSDMNGAFVLGSLIPGQYRVEITQSGFKQYVADPVNVDINGFSDLEVTMEVGNSTEQVTVQASALTLNREQAEVANTLELKAVTELPLEVGQTATGPARRQIDSFVFLVPGAQGDTFSHRFNGGVSFSNEVLYDGIPLVEFEAAGWQSVSNPPFEAIDEFKVLTSVFSAQYGHGQGVSNYHIASGTNSFHGNAFEYFRNDALDARGFYSRITPINRQNEYGFTLGGPIVLPKLYSGHNRTFFRTSIGWYSYRGAPVNTLLTVPTTAMKKGDFSQFVDGSGKQIPIFDPTTGMQFPGNVIPVSRFSSVSNQLLKLIPDPTFPGIVNNIGPGVRNLPTDDFYFSYNLDHSFSQNQRINFSQWKNNQVGNSVINTNIPGPLNGLTRAPSKANEFKAQYTAVISPNLVATVGTLWNLQTVNQEVVNINTAVSFPGLPTNTVFPAISFSGPVAAPVQLGRGSLGDLDKNPGVSLVNNWGWTKGRHSLNFGWEVRGARNNNVIGANYPASFNFTNASTSLPGSANFSQWGSPFASFLLGIADSAQANNPIGPRSIHNYSTSGYIQDDLKLTSRLTLNLGLRYDVFLPVTEEHNRLVFFDPTRPNPAAGGLLGAISVPGSNCSVCYGRERVADIRWNNVAPRFGFTYALTPKTIIRGGYGIIYLQGGANELGNTRIKTGFNNGLSGTANFTSTDAGVTPGYGSWDKPFPFPPATPLMPSTANGQTVNYLDKYMGTAPYVQNWAIGVQTTLLKNMVVSATYVANKGVRLPAALENLNQLDPKYLGLGNTLLAPIGSPAAIKAGIQSPYSGFTGSVAQALRPYPQFSGISSNFDESGASRYDSFQLSAQRRFTNGLQYLISYTLSRQMSNTDSGFSVFNAGPLNTYNRKGEYSLAPSDIPNVVAISSVYELPIGPGKAFLNKKSISGTLLGGWQVAGVLHYQSGDPLSVSARNVLPLFGGGNRPNLVPGVNPEVSNAHFDPATSSLINPSAFSQPADFTFGNAPRVLGNLRAFPLLNEDVNLGKHFRFEPLDIEFRAEFFNVFNRVRFSDPNTSFSTSNANFGHVGGQSNLPRQGQLSLRVTF